MLFTSAFLTLTGFALLGWISQKDWFYQGLGVDSPSTATALLLFMLTAPVFTVFLKPVIASFQRRFEFEADDFASDHTQATHLITALVKLYSDGPNAAAGGDLGWIDEPRLRPEFAQALKGLKAGDVTGAINTDEGTYFLRLEQYEPGVTASYLKLNGELRDKVESKLKEAAYAEYIEKLKKDAIIRYYY